MAPRGVLTSPDTCGPHRATSELTPFSSTTNATPSSEFELSNGANGGPCPKKLGERPFSPTYTAGTVSHKAGKFSPFELHITRPNGAQEIGQVKVDLPPGMVAKLKGTEYCPEAGIAAGGSIGQSRAGEPELPVQQPGRHGRHRRRLGHPVPHSRQGVSRGSVQRRTAELRLRRAGRRGSV